MDGAASELSIDPCVLTVTNTRFHGTQFRWKNWDLRRFTSSHRRIRCICTFARDINRSLPSWSNTSPCEVNRRGRKRLRSWTSIRGAEDDRKAIERRCHWYVVFNCHADRTWKYCGSIHRNFWKRWCCESVGKATADADDTCLLDAARSRQIDQHNSRRYRIQDSKASEIALRRAHWSRFEVRKRTRLLPTWQ